MPLTIVWIVAVMNMVNFLDGMDGLAAGVCAISGVDVRHPRALARQDRRRVLSAIVAGACIGFLRHNFFPARIFMGDSGALVLGFTLATVSVAGLLKTASTVVLVPAAPRARGPDHRYVVRRREAAQVPAADLLGRPVAPPPPLHAHRLLAAARGRHDVGLDCEPRGRRARDAVHPASARAVSGTCGETIAVVAIALAALAFSVYVVYLLEIVKLANPRVRRRRAQASDEERLSA